MCGGGGGGAPKVKKAPTPPPVVTPIDADADAKRAGNEERRKRMAASGRSDTILTGGLGSMEPAQTGGKKLLGA